MKAEFAQLRARITGAQEAVELLKKEEEEGAQGRDDADHFATDMYDACVIGAPGELLELTAVMNETQDLVTATAGFFGERTEGLQEMLQTLNMFVNEFRRVKEEAEARRRRGLPDEFKF